jgi:hypothetical protein
MNSPPLSSAAPAEKSLSSDGEAETGNLVEKRISKPLTHVEVVAERIMSSVVRSIDGLERLSSELRQLQTFLKSEVERVQTETLAGIKIIIETIAPSVRAVRAGANIESAQFRSVEQISREWSARCRL